MRNKQQQVEKWRAELKRLETLPWRWGETRRFQSFARKINRRNWLIDRLARAEAGANE